MREIKFRAWDRKRKKMFPVHELKYGKISNELGYLSGVDIYDKDSDHEGDIWYGGSANKMTGNPLVPRFELMQFTGLHDKNGKEICEGDIVHYKYNTDLKYGGWGSDSIGIIKWKSTGFYLDTLPNRGGICSWLVSIPGMHAEGSKDVIEILGNIYENPELLEVA